MKQKRYISSFDQFTLSHDQFIDSRIYIKHNQTNRLVIECCTSGSVNEKYYKMLEI